ncbi:MAG: hypothetical protein J6S60_09950 [Oscillospiraceae bacterium]|nr:hypothetical protein [Oscillospiraceae bacterium]
MSDKPRFELNRAGVRELLRSPEVQDMLLAEAETRAAPLGDGYAVDAVVGKNRVTVRIKAVSSKARREAYKDNTLLQAIS